MESDRLLGSTLLEKKKRNEEGLEGIFLSMFASLERTLGSYSSHHHIDDDNDGGDDDED